MYQLILLRDTADQIILQSNWLRGRTGQTPPNVVLPHAFTNFLQNI